MERNYSGVTVAKKLGIGEGSSIVVINKPQHYEEVLGEIAESLIIHTHINKTVGFIHYFAHEKSDLQAVFPKLKEFLLPSGMLWVSWAKKSSGINSDLTENIVMNIGLQHGLVDVKVVSFDETWSALKFVYRLKDRN